MKDPFFSEVVVLKEVRDAFSEAGGGKVGVIIEPHRDYEPKDILQKLEDMNIRGARATDHWVMANLTETQVNKLEHDKAVFKIFKSKDYKGSVATSSTTIKSKPASQLFDADGDGISWAVLDTGIKANHTYFMNEPRIEQKSEYNFTRESLGDRVGHGTHVAGIIRKLAPKTKIYDFKVLGQGGSTSFTIIEAMYNIRKINHEARRIVIHGVNMSLGGPVQVGSYGCGFSPECQEANRLVDSGVIVCVAASNDGYKTLATIDEENKLDYYSTFLDMGIADPGNAEKVITVGSCHKVYPHKYGISWFSSKGPTGDGRYKPDLIAPGERIESAGIKNVDQVVSMSGTSMATPHVSAAIAQFLSVKREFIGYPGEVKKILMDTCTDLGRDRYFQGAGLIDVLRMIQAV